MLTEAKNVIMSCLDGELIIVSSGWQWEETSTDENNSYRYIVAKETEVESNVKWFNVRLDYSGRYIESSEAYDTEEDALDHKLKSDTDTIKVKV